MNGGDGPDDRRRDESPAADDGRPDPLARRVGATPDRTALVDAATGESWRFDELDAAVDDRAGRLAGLGLEAGDRLGLLVGTSIEAVRLVHAGWRLGLRLVPLNVRLAESEFEAQAERADLDALVCGPAEAAVAGSIASCRVAATAGGGSKPAAEPATAGVSPLSAVESGSLPRFRWHDDHPAVCMFTSGTTGRPKLVPLTMGNLLASATASAFRLGVAPGDRWLLCLPIYHMGGLAPLLRTTLYGTTLVVREGFDPVGVARETHDYGVTGLSLVPTQLDRILDGSSGLADSVRTVLVGGAPAPASLLERCRAGDVPVHPTYGLTETASQVATATPVQAFEHPGTVGQPLLDVEVTVVDEDREPVGPGQRGEIVVSGPTVTPGYDDPETTTEAFCEHGLLTGDLGYVDDAGRLWVVGRRSARIVTGGENVDPEAVAAVLRDHSDVAEAAVVGVPDDEWGERVAALLVPGDAVDPDVESVLAHCRDRLAGFEVPGRVRVVDALPRTASGTVDREAVRERFRD